jgi:hypothetical protein
MLDILLVGANTTSVELLALDHTLATERAICRKKLDSTPLLSLHVSFPLCHVRIITGKWNNATLILSKWLVF